MKPIAENNCAELHFFCGKMAAGKSTLAMKLSQQKNAILIVEDAWLSHLFPSEINTINNYINYSARLKPIISELVINLLNQRICVVLDFPANTIQQRLWFSEIINRSNASHTLHYVNVSNNTCLKQLKKRSGNISSGSAFTTEKEFYEITHYFQAPSSNEGFNIKEHC